MTIEEMVAQMRRFISAIPLGSTLDEPVRQTASSAFAKPQFRDFSSHRKFLSYTRV